MRNTSELKRLSSEKVGSLRTSSYSESVLLWSFKSLAAAGPASKLAPGREQEVGNGIWPTLEGV